MRYKRVQITTYTTTLLVPVCLLGPNTKRSEFRNDEETTNKTLGN